MHLDGFRRILLLAILAASCVAAPVRAASIAWTNPAGGLWSEPTNWSSATVPGPDDDVLITLDGQYAVTVDPGAVSIRSLTLGGTIDTQQLLATGKMLSLATGAGIGAHGSVEFHDCTVTSATAIVNHGELLFDATSLAGDLVNYGVATRNPSAILNGTVDNYGKLVMEGVTTASPALVQHPGSTLRIEGTPTTPAEFDFTGTYTNVGTLDLACALGFGNVTVKATSPDGVLVNAPGAVMHSYAAGARVVDADLENDGMLEVLQLLTLPRAGARHVNRGALELSEAGVTVSGAGVVFTNQGTLTIGAGHTFSQGVGTFANDSCGVIRGAGTCNVAAATTLERGRIVPGDPAGQLTFPGNVTVDPGGAVDIVIGGPTAADWGVLRLTGFMIPNGTLAVSLANGFVPAPGDRFDVIGWGDHSGVFSRIDGLDLGGNLALRPEYATSGLTLVCFAGHVAGVEPDPARAPALEFSRAPAPNPTAGGTSFVVRVPRAAALTVTVTDAAGRELATVWRGRLAAGEHAFHWDGATAAGTRAPAGVYFVAVRGAGAGLVGRLAIVR